MSERIQRVDPAQQANWDSRLARQPGRSFFHGLAWSQVLVRSYGYAPEYFIADGPGELAGLLPFMEVNSWLTGRRGIALPFTDDCEPLARDAGMFQDLWKAALDFGRERNWKQLECRGGRERFGDVPASVSFRGHSLDLTAGEASLFAGLDSSTRRAVRKAEKGGLTVTVSQSLEAVDSFYRLLCRTRKKHGLPPQPFSFFRNIQEQVLARDMGSVVLASHADRPVAASVYFHLGDRAIYKYGASDERFQELRGSNLVMWEAIKWQARRGAKTLHFGRTSLDNEGLRRFKLGWGAVEHPIDYFKFDLRRDQFVAGADEASGWHNRVFRALPMSVSRLIGAWLYRHSA